MWLLQTLHYYYPPSTTQHWRTHWKECGQMAASTGKTGSSPLSK